MVIHPPFINTCMNTDQHQTINGWLYTQNKLICLQCEEIKSLNKFGDSPRKGNFFKYTKCLSCNDKVLKHRHGPASWNIIKKRLVNSETLNPYGQPVRQDPTNPKLGQVLCAYNKCDGWFNPRFIEVNNRKNIIHNDYHDNCGESLLYCSDECKSKCSKYGKSAVTIMREDAIKSGRLPWWELNREIQPELRRMVLKRDNFTCQRCTSNMNLECHHKVPDAQNPMLSADVDNCITLCEKCHTWMHVNIPYLTVGYLIKQKQCLIDNNRPVDR